MSIAAKPSSVIAIFILMLCISLTAIAAEDQVEPTPKADTQQTKEDKPLTQDDKDYVSPRFDPKHQQYLRGKLAYWFKDYKRAMGNWLPLAEEGNASAQASVGWLYHNGFGVEQDYEEAIKWYRKSAEQGYVIGQHNLGMMYENGWGVKQDYKEALKWYQLSADQAYGLSLFNLGLLYKNGFGVEADKDKAIHLLKQAYRLKVDQAWDVLDEMGVKIKKRKSTHAPVQPPVPGEKLPNKHKPIGFEQPVE